MPGKPLPPAVALEGARRLEALRIRGAKGGVIRPHRAMAGIPWTGWRFLTTSVLALGGLAGYVALLPWLGRFWALLFNNARSVLALDATIAPETLSVGPVWFTLPQVAAVTPLPDARVLQLAGLVSLGVLGLSLVLPQRFTPLKYFLRLLVVIQATALLFFWQSPEPFPYRITDHVFILLTSGLVVMGLVPLVLGLTLHVFDLALWRKILLTVLILGHLAVFVPLNVLVHVWLLLHATAVIMPLLFLVFGLLLYVFIFVAFYGWALSWRSDLERREVPPPVHLG
ncbi:MAG: hypothetical protein ACT4PM_04190 [Gemmatimonadales bacterium]